MARPGADPDAPVLPKADREKRAASAAAIELVRDGMVVGLGTGSTAEMFLALLAERVRGGLSVVGVPTSARTRAMAERLGIRLCPAETVPAIDLAIDGADEIDPELRLIKGAGGALLFEKIVASASHRMIVIADSSKRVGRLGQTFLPVEVVPFGWERTAGVIADNAARFGSGPFRFRRRGEENPFRTDSGHFIVDCEFGPVGDAAGLAAFLDGQPGVVEHGLFIGLCSAALIGSGDGAEVLGRLP